LGEAASLGAARSTLLVGRATVQEEDTLAEVASVWAVAMSWVGGGARWAVACALVKTSKHSAAVVLALDPLVGHQSRFLSVTAGPPTEGIADKPSVAPSMCPILGRQCVASGLKKRRSPPSNRVILPGCWERGEGVRGAAGGGGGGTRAREGAYIWGGR